MPVSLLSLTPTRRFQAAPGRFQSAPEDKQ
jgi:hypothetical protein